MNLIPQRRIKIFETRELVSNAPYAGPRGFERCKGALIPEETLKRVGSPVTGAIKQ